jgi:hypothetical protein
MELGGCLILALPMWRWSPITIWITSPSPIGWASSPTARSAMYPFVAPQVVGLMLCIHFPGISLWLPRLAGFLE